jgi:hypothetical protein
MFVFNFIAIINNIAENTLKATKILFFKVLPFLELGEIIIALSNIVVIFYTNTLLPDSLLNRFLEASTKNNIIFFSNYQVFEPKLHNATNEKPSSTIDRRPPIILKYSSTTCFP